MLSIRYYLKRYLSTFTIKKLFLCSNFSTTPLTCMQPVQQIKRASERNVSEETRGDWGWWDSRQ